MSAKHTTGTAADGKTELIHLPSHPLLVSAVEFNKAIAQRDQLLAVLSGVAAIAHSGGLAGMDEGGALVAIRRATLRYWDKAASDEQARAAIAKVEGGAV